MLNFLWWFVVGPIVGWLAGRLMRTGQNGWLDALTGLVGAILVGTLCDLAGLGASGTGIEAMISGAAGALAVTFLFRKVMGRRAAAAQSTSRSASYTSYKSRMGK